MGSYIDFSGTRIEHCTQLRLETLSIEPTDENQLERYCNQHTSLHGLYLCNLRSLRLLEKNIGGSTSTHTIANCDLTSILSSLAVLNCSRLPCITSAGSPFLKSCTAFEYGLRSLHSEPARE